MAHTNLRLTDNDEIICFCGNEMVMEYAIDNITRWPNCSHCGNKLTYHCKLHLCSKHSKHKNNKELITNNKQFRNVSLYDHILCHKCRKNRIGQQTLWNVSRDHYVFFKRIVKNDD